MDEIDDLKNDIISALNEDENNIDVNNNINSYSIKSNNSNDNNKGQFFK